MLRPRSLVLLVLLSSLQVLGQANLNGSWSPLETWPYRAVHAHLMPSGKVLFWSYYDESLTPQIWDPVSDSVSAAAPISYAIFCAGHSMLADGRLLVTGGHLADYVGLPNASIYDPFKNSWKTLPDMNEGRWYPTNTTLANGDVVVVGGSIDSITNVDTLPQVYQVASNSWRNLTSAQLALPLYPRLFLAPNGKVFESGPDPTSRYLNTAGQGAWTSVATMNLGSSRDYGSAVMYQPGKIVTMGGGDPPTATAETIDLNSATPAWKNTGSMAFARRQLNATVLPDGKVLVTGGSSGSGFDNENTPVETSEIWDPATGDFTKLATESTYRGYHSIAILLPDGRVLSAGGNDAGPTAQVFSPPYLFEGTRPVITSAPKQIAYGSTFAVGAPEGSAITAVSLIRVGTVTHAFNMDQRFMPLSYTPVGGGLTAVAPPNANIAPPGYYLLFLLQNDVPSVAAILKVSGAAPKTSTISGQVVTSSGVPLSGATVSDGAGATTTTDSGGSYLFAAEPAGTVTLTASEYGFNSSSVHVNVTAGAKITAPTIALTSVAGASPQPKVTLSSSSSNATVKAGQSASYNLTVTPQNGPFNQSLTFACSGLPKLSSCNFNPSNVTPGASSVSVTLTVATTAPTTTVASTSPGRIPWGTAIGFVAVFGMVGFLDRKGRRSKVLTYVALLGVVALCASCGGGGSANTHAGSEPVSTAQAGTSPGTYNVSIAGSSAGQQIASTVVGLTVQ